MGCSPNLKTVPQLDRIDKHGRRRHAHDAARVANARPAQETRPGDRGFPAAKLALAEYATRDKTTVHGDLAKEKAPDLVFAAKMMASSTHVPITLDGAKGTINFWSMEREAFPEEAVATLKEAAAAMTKKQ